MRHTTRRLFLAAGAAFAAAPAIAAPSSKLIAGPWRQFGSAGDPDHSAWGGFLQSYRTEGPGGIARVRYAAAARDGARLTGYLGALQAVDPTSLTRAAAMAYWVNLYNALTVDLVLEAFPVNSIKEVRGGLFNTGPWTEKAVTVAGRELSLDDIEHGILRPIWGDPRIHYAVNCAALGCPNLDAQPFASGDLDARLNAAAKRFVDHPRGVAEQGGGVVLSSIYDWFAADFGGTETGVLAHINEHRAQQVAGPVRDYDYDWSLNAA